MNKSGVILRRLERNDAEKLSLIANNKRIFDNVRDYFPHPYTLQNAEEFIGWCEKEEVPVTFAIQYKSELAGVIGLVLQSDVYRRSAEIGYWLGEPFWNKGIVTEAVQMMIRYAFNNLKIIRLFTGVFEYNKASRRVLEKCGFKLEGIFNQSVVKNDVLYNEFRYGLVNSKLVQS